MKLTTLKFNTVFFLFCVSNVLNIFLDRGSTAAGQEAGGSRAIIHLINGLIAIFMLLGIFNARSPKVFTWVKLLALTLLVYLVKYFFVPHQNDYTITHYFKFFINLIGFLFFYHAYLKMDKDQLQKYIHVYVYTLMLASMSKILSTKMFLSDNLGGGDTASISLVFLIPLLFLFFKPKSAILLYLVAFGLTIISLRRTSIIAFAISIPFIFPTLKRNINLIHLVIVTLFSTLLLIFVIQYFGSSLATRFLEMTDDSGKGVGSGRSVFYLILLDDFFRNPNSYIWGNGINSVWAFYDANGFYYLPHAHNDFLELLYTFGFWGLTVWIIFLFSLFKLRKKLNINPDHKKYYVMALFLYLIVALASGTLLRIEMIPIVMSIAFFLAEHTIEKDEKDTLLLSGA